MLFACSLIYLTLCSDGTEPFESALDAVEDWQARLKRRIQNKIIAPIIASAVVATLLVFTWPTMVLGRHL